MDIYDVYDFFNWLCFNLFGLRCTRQSVVAVLLIIVLPNSIKCIVSVLSSDMFCTNYRRVTDVQCWENPNHDLI